MQTKLKLGIILVTFPLWIVPMIVAMWIYIIYCYITERK